MAERGTAPQTDAPSDDPTWTVSQSDVESRSARALIQKGMQDVTVTCDGPLEARVGATVGCTVTYGEKTQESEAKVTRVVGTSVYFHIDSVPRPTDTA